MFEVEPRHSLLYPKYLSYEQEIFPGFGFSERTAKQTSWVVADYQRSLLLAKTKLPASKPTDG